MAKSNASKYKRIGEELYELRANTPGGPKRWQRIANNPGARGSLLAGGRSSMGLAVRLAAARRDNDRLKYLPPSEEAFREERRRIRVRTIGTVLGVGVGAGVGFAIGRKVFDGAQGARLAQQGFQSAGSGMMHTGMSDDLYKGLVHGFGGTRSPGARGVGEGVRAAAKRAVGQFDDAEHLRALSQRVAAGVHVDDALRAVGQPLSGRDFQKVSDFIKDHGQDAYDAAVAKELSKLKDTRQGLRQMRTLQGLGSGLAMSQGGLNQGNQLANQFNESVDRMRYAKKAREQEAQQIAASEEKIATAILLDERRAERHRVRAEREQARARGIDRDRMGRAYSGGEHMDRTLQYAVQRAIELQDGRSFAAPGAPPNPPRPGLFRRMGPDGRMHWYNPMKGAGARIGNTRAGQAAKSAVGAGQRVVGAYERSHVGKVMGGLSGTVGAGMAVYEGKGAIERAKARKAGTLNDGGGLGKDLGGIAGGYAGDRAADHFVSKALANPNAPRALGNGVSKVGNALAKRLPMAARGVARARVANAAAGAASRLGKGLSSPMGRLGAQVVGGLAANYVGKKAGQLAGSGADKVGAFAAARKRKRQMG